MHRAFAAFQSDIADSRNLSALYGQLAPITALSTTCDDLLRAQIVYAVSALDKLIHDLIRIGCVQIFSSIRQPTPKYLSESITIDIHQQIEGAIAPSKQQIFELHIYVKMSRLSFQDPDKISDGLSLIWNADDKWKQIGHQMSMTAKNARTKLKLVVGRRNSIVHEADRDPVTGSKKPISPATCADMTDFVEQCGSSIFALVR